MTSKDIVENAIEEGKYIGGEMVNIIISLTNLGNLKSDLERLEKLEKMVELVKLLNISVLEGKEDDELCYQVYCKGNKAYITKEEYELLKEVLEDGK